MATVQTFEELQVWQEARALMNAIYRASRLKPFSGDHDLKSQIRRAALPTMTNIAEGFERGTQKEFVQFLNFAKGSNGEVRSQLWAALDLQYLTRPQFDVLCEQTKKLSRRLASFIRYLETCRMKTRVQKPQNLQPSTFNMQLIP
jgi:four helix bundle protein